MARKPTIRKGVASHYAQAGESIYDVGDGRSGALIRVYRDPANAAAPLVIEVYRADDDVVVRAPRTNVDTGAMLDELMDEIAADGLS